MENTPSSASGKYISFRPKGKKRFVRGSEKGLGAGYTKERISERIAEKLSQKADFKFMTMEKFLKRRQNRLDPNQRFLSGNAQRGRSPFVDTSGEKFQKSPGLMKWAKRQNLKAAAELYAENGSQQEAQKEILRYQKLLQEAHSTTKLLDQRSRELAEAVYYAQVYQENCTVREQYRKSADKERFFREHEAEIVLFDGAKGYLEKVGALEFCNSMYSGNSEVFAISGFSVSLEQQIQQELEEIHGQRLEIQNLIDEVEQKIRAIERNEKMVSKWVGENLANLENLEKKGIITDRRNTGTVEQV